MSQIEIDPGIAPRFTVADLQRAQAAALRRDDWHTAARYEAAIAERVAEAQARPAPRTPRDTSARPAAAAGRAKADQLLARRRERVSRIRRRVATGAVSLFLAATALLTVRLATGHDPALASTGSGGSAAGSAAASAAQYSPSTSSSSTTKPDTSTGATDSGSAGASPPVTPTPAAPSPSPVTTSQS